MVTAELRNDIKLTFSADEVGLLERIKDKLTFDNPKYAQVKRYSRYKYTKVPPYLTYYSGQHRDRKEDTISIHVPIGTNLEDLFNNPLYSHFDYEVVDYRVEPRVTYPISNFTLRDDQSKAFKSFVESCVNELPHHHYSQGAGVVSMPTGKGKTILGIYIAQWLKVKTLVLVHKDDLVTGWKKDISQFFGGKLEAGLIKAKTRDTDSNIVIATVQTLSRMKEEELDKYLDMFGLIITDECHHIASTTFNIVGEFNAKYKLGLSATPKRSDGLTPALFLYNGPLVFKLEYKKSDKDILPCKVILQKSKAKYLPFVAKEKGTPVDQVFNYYDFLEEDLPRDYCLVQNIPYNQRPRISFSTIDDCVVTNRAFKIQVCKKVLEHATQGHSCLLLFTQKEHIDLYYIFLKRYFPKEKIMKFYGDSKEKSSVLMERADSKEVLITLATLAKTTEGTNVKAWEVLFLISSMNDSKNIEQATGRIRRVKDGKLKPVLVYDYYHSEVYSMRNHISTHLSTFKRLKYDIDYGDTGLLSDSGKMFSRGYNTNV